MTVPCLSVLRVRLRARDAEALLASLLVAACATAQTTKLSLDYDANSAAGFEKLAAEGALKLDFRYEPGRWQTCIGLVDDPFKSIVGSDGALYYDYGGGPYYDFRTRISAGLAGGAKPHTRKQWLESGRLPIVHTLDTYGKIQLESVAFAAAPGASRPRADLLRVRIENTGSATETVEPVAVFEAQSGVRIAPDGASVEAGGKPLAYLSPGAKPPPPKPADNSRLMAVGGVSPGIGWGQPAGQCSQAFRDVLIGWGEPLRFEFRAEKGKRYQVAFGTIESFHTAAGNRVMDIVADGKVLTTVDPASEPGPNLPAIVIRTVEAAGEKLALEVRPAARSKDTNVVLAALWVFRDGGSPAADELFRGEAPGALGYVDASRAAGSTTAKAAFGSVTLKPFGVWECVLTLPQQPGAKRVGVPDLERELIAARKYWQTANLPYGVLSLPDPAVQTLLDSCVRNIYQARERKNGILAFQVGPTCYRGLWAVDGAFLLEAVSFLGRASEARECMKLLLEGDTGPGGIEFSKKAGIHLWTIWRHAQLTGDKAWLRAHWPLVKREVERIQEYRKMSLQDDTPKNDGLMPRGTGDGGLGGMHYEYTNVHWNLAGLWAAVEAAKWLGKKDDLGEWADEFQSFSKAFDKARERDALTDAHGNRYMPIVMQGEEPQLPQCSQWTFLQAIYPGQIFADKDPLMLGTMAMLDAVNGEGLIYGTGWLRDGIWNYAGGFYGEANLWLKRYPKTAAVLCAFGNHASPTLCWREEQGLNKQENYCGDMPHNWASAEFIRLVRNSLVLERDDELHLLSALPTAWTRPGMVIEVKGVATTFGEMSLRVEVSKNGAAATVRVTPPERAHPSRIVVHLAGFGPHVVGARMAGTEVQLDGDLKADPTKPFTLKLRLAK